MPVSVLTQWSVIKCVFIHHPAWLHRHTLIVLVCPTADTHTHTLMGSVWLWGSGYIPAVILSKCSILASLSLTSLYSGERTQGAVSLGQGAGKASALKGVSVCEFSVWVNGMCVCVSTDRGSVRAVHVYIQVSAFVLFKGCGWKACMHTCVFAHGCFCECAVSQVEYTSAFSGWTKPVSVN